MGSQVWFMLVLLALAMVAECSTTFNKARDSRAHFGNGEKSPCNGRQCGGNVEDTETETMMDSETNRRLLAQGRRYISYGALRANSVPCNRPGQSYYNCQQGGRANPYNRGCSAITHCRRSTG